MTARLSDLSVLIVEDEIIVGMMLRKELKGAGATSIGPVTSIADAMMKVLAHPIDIALLDAKLVDHSAGNLADFLQERQIPYVVIGGYDQGALLHALKSFVAKPVSLSTLIEAIEGTLGSRRQSHPGADAKAATNGRRRVVDAMSSDIDTFSGIEDTRALARAIVDTVSMPLVVLDHQLRVVTASRSFYLTFNVDRQKTQGTLLYELGDGQWDIPELRVLLERLLPEHGALDGYEVERMFPHIGQRIMTVSARQVHYASGGPAALLLAIDDITDRRILERQLNDLLKQKDTLLEEIQHRVANSLAIIASILLLKARTVESPETRQHLQDAHDRVMSLASVQNHLHSTGRGGSVDVAPYLRRLCETLAASMVSADSKLTMEVDAGEGAFSSSHAVSLGLVVTELVINALKHAFRTPQPTPRITVTYASSPAGWSLSVADNGQGVGEVAPQTRRSRTGLGTSIVESLARQLGASVSTQTGNSGTTVNIVHRSAET